MTKTIINENRYIQPETLEQCFELGSFNYVDKVICGNGFSTAFINAKPPRNKINIIIAPNRAVIMSKEASYRKEGNPSGNRIKFFYKDSEDTDLLDAEVLMFVSDSFLLMKSKIEFIQDRLNWVLIDEAHSVEIQSSFRRNLINFTKRVQEIIGEQPALTCVTASPNYFTKIDIKIQNLHVPEIDINLCKDWQKSIAKINKLRKEGEKVLVATNNKNVIYRLKDKDSVLEANFVIGEGLSRNLVELVTIKQNPDSDLTIISSRGFEGFDVYGEGYNVFFFEDRGSVSGFETFYIANLYQAINRVRAGAKYIEYVRKDLSNARKVPFKNIEEEVEEFINREDISVYQKQSLSPEKKFYNFHPYVIFWQNREEDSEDYGKYTIEKNEASISLLKETLIYDKPFPAPEFEEFLSDRNISIKDCREIQKKLPDIKLKDAYKEERLLSNSEYISKLDLFGEDYKLFVRPKDKVEDYIRELNKYIRRKNYDKERGLIHREKIALKLLTNKDDFNQVLKELTKTYNERSINKYGYKASKSYRESFKTKAVTVLLNMITMFTNEKIVVPSKWVANRDYNVLTEIGVPEIILVSKVFGIETTEIDVNSCFIRVVYALNHKTLPDDFYGENKENKLKVNIFLNDFFYNPEKKTPKKIQYLRAKNTFLEYGFDKDVTEYLMNTFFESRFRGGLFNFLTFYEKQVVSKLKKIALEEFKTEGVGRRHDSLILFNNESDLQRLNHLEFLGREGWFKVSEDNLGLKESYQEWFEREIAPEKGLQKCQKK